MPSRYVLSAAINQYHGITRRQMDALRYKNVLRENVHYKRVEGMRELLYDYRAFCSTMGFECAPEAVGATVMPSVLAREIGIDPRTLRNWRYISRIRAGQHYATLQTVGGYAYKFKAIADLMAHAFRHGRFPVA
jgi:hypothetical protein